MLRLYPQPGLRTFCDLDILIPSDMISQFKQTMTKAGYKPLSIKNSPEDEELQKFDGHLNPLRKEEGFMIEPHLTIQRGWGDYVIAIPEVWQEKEEINDGGIVFHLNAEHFILQSLLHYRRHLSNKGFVEIKGFIDVLYVMKTRAIDWSKFWDATRRWMSRKKFHQLCQH